MKLSELKQVLSNMIKDGKRIAYGDGFVVKFIGHTRDNNDAVAIYDVENSDKVSIASYIYVYDKEKILEAVNEKKEYLVKIGFIDDLNDTNKDKEQIEKEDTGFRYNKGKPRMELIEPGFMEEVAKILTFGAEKYEKDNWKKFDKEKRFQTIGSLMRHLEAHRKGEKIDPESGCSHLCHIVTNAMFLWWFDRNPLDK